MRNIENRLAIFIEWREDTSGLTGSPVAEVRLRLAHVELSRAVADTQHKACDAALHEIDGVDTPFDDNPAYRLLVHLMKPAMDQSTRVTSEPILRKVHQDALETVPIGMLERLHILFDAGEASIVVDPDKKRASMS